MTLSDNGEDTSSLPTYLHDHAAGARQAVELLTALRDHSTDTPFAAFADSLLGQIKEDLDTLESLATQIGAEAFQAKEVAGWLADKLTRMKLSPLNKPFHTFEALEFLSLGILGKRALWKALAAASPANPRLSSVDLRHLLQRAEEQYSATEAMRIEFAAQVFG